MLFLLAASCAPKKIEATPETTIFVVPETKAISFEGILLEYFWSITYISKDSQMYFLFVENYSGHQRAENYVTLAKDYLSFTEAVNKSALHHKFMSAEEKYWSLSTSDLNNKVETLLSTRDVSEFISKANKGESIPALYLGRAYSEGIIVQKDELVASKYTELSCKSGILRACNSIGYQSETANVPDLNKAIEHYEHACSNGNLMGCSNVGSHSKGARELLYKSKACLGGYARGCYDLGVILKYSGKVKDIQLGNAVLNKSCNLGYKDACKYVDTK
jgi:TPR repeat protein